MTAGRTRWIVAAVLAVVLTITACGGSGSSEFEDVADLPSQTTAPPPYHVYVTNERAGNLSVIAGGTHNVLATIPLGKRPRGIKVSPDRTQLFVALSGSPPSPPGTDESTLPPPDRSADGIGVVDIASAEMVTMVRAGTDPEQVAVSADGTKLYVANEDAGVVSVVEIASGEVLATLKVGGEPEGVRISPDGSVVYVTSEEDNQVSVIDTAGNEVIAQFGVRETEGVCICTGWGPCVRHRREQWHGACYRYVDTRRNAHDPAHRGNGQADGRCSFTRREPYLCDDRTGSHGRCYRC